MEFTVFYAWQNDRPGKTTRYLIRDALQDAIRTIVADATIDDCPRLDSDTRDVTGTPAIAETIFEKIRTCGVFVADVTFVTTIESDEGPTEPKLIPNPNVLVELGYAAAAIGWERIVCVMNTAFGPPDRQIFDLSHRRRPIQYDLLNDTPGKRKPARLDLAQRFEEAIRAIVDAGHLDDMTHDPGESRWSSRLLSELIDLQIMTDEFEERMLEPWLDEAQYTCKSAATTFRELACSPAAQQGFIADIHLLAEVCDEMANDVRRMHLGSGPQLKEVSQRLGQNAEALFKRVLQEATVSGESQAAAKNEIIQSARRLADIALRLNAYLDNGRIDELKDEITGIAGEVLRFTYYPVNFLNDQERHALRSCSRNLHLLDTVRLYMDGGQSEQALVDRVKAGIDQFNTLLADPVLSNP